MQRIHFKRRTILCFTSILASGLIGCFNLDADGNESTAGLASTIPGEGPEVVFEPIIDEQGKIPIVPIPSDTLTRIDSSSPTGRYLNISVAAGQAQFEEELRASMDRRDGFGTLAPIWVAFRDPTRAKPAPREGYGPNNPDPQPIQVKPVLDLKTVNNDTVLLIQLQDCERYPKGTRFPLSLPDVDPYKDATGMYVKKLQTAWVGEQKGFFPNDPYTAAPDLFFDQETDMNGDGFCHADEDLNHDGLCDFVGNKVDWDGDGVPERYVDFYDIRNHISGYDTLVLRPLYVLDQQCKYAVVLTRNIHGLPPEGSAVGLPIRSPFENVNHTAQTKDLEPLKELLPQYHLNVNDIAFTWSFTTGTQTKVLEAMTTGVEGKGPFGFLKKENPIGYTEIVDFKDPDLSKGKGTGSGNTHLLKPEPFLPIALILGGLTIGSFGAGEKLVENLKNYVDYIVFGSFNTADFLTSKHRPGADTASARIILDYRNAIDLETASLDNLPQGERAAPGNQDVPFICIIPKARPELGIEPPFPVIFYGHGYTSDRIEVLGFGANFARQGFAACSYSAAQHGPQDDFKDLRAFASDLGIIDLDGNDLGLGSDEEAIKIVPELLRQEIVGTSEPQCQEKYGKNCNAVTYEEAFGNTEYIVQLITNLIVEGLKPKLCPESTPRVEEIPACIDASRFSPATQKWIDFTSAVIEATDINAFSEFIQLEPKDRCNLLDAITQRVQAKAKKIVGNDPTELVNELSNLALNLVKSALRWQIDVYCTDVKRPSDISLSTDIGDMLDKAASCTVFKELATKGRARAIDSKGQTRGGGDYWVADTFHTHAVVTQTVLDQKYFIETLKQCDPAKGVEGGDFNLDGVCDLGTEFYTTGSSLGGIAAMMQAAVIPEVQATYPSSGAAGLPDVASRTFQGGVWEAVYGELLCSPCVFGRKNLDENKNFVNYEISLAWSDINQETSSHSEYTTDLDFVKEMGQAKVVIQNLTNGDEAVEYARTDGTFRGAVRSDKGDRIKAQIYTKAGALLWEKEYESPVKGFGFRRNSEDLFRFLNIAYHVVSPADPAVYANRNATFKVATGDPWGFEIINKRGANRTSDAGVVNLVSSGDSNVPVNTGTNYSRLFGAFDWDFHRTLIEHGVYNGAVGPAYVALQKNQPVVCMEETPQCASTIGNKGDICRDTDGNPVASNCFNLYAWMPDVIPIPDPAKSICGKITEQTSEGSPDCAPAPDASQAAVCGVSVSYAPQADGSLAPFNEDPTTLPGPLAPLQWQTTRSDGKTPVEASARFALMSCKENWHGIEPADPNRLLEGCPGGDIVFDWGTYETGRMTYFFRTGLMRDFACFENDSCNPKEVPNYVPPMD